VGVSTLIVVTKPFLEIVREPSVVHGGVGFASQNVDVMVCFFHEEDDISMRLACQAVVSQRG